MSTALRELHRHKGSLLFARKLLNAALLLQLPFVLLLVLQQVELMWHLNLMGHWKMSNKVFWLLSLSSSGLAIVGFTVVCRQLSLWQGDLETTEFVQRTRLLGTVKIAAGVQFFFYLAFLMPLLNLIPALWARSQASTALVDLERLAPTRRR